MKFSLETPRLIIREWKDSDLSGFIRMNQDPRVMEFFPSSLTPEESEAMLKRIQAHHREHGFGIWAAELKTTQEFIGFLGLQQVSFAAFFTPAVEIGWRLLPEHWGKGLATEGAKALLNYGFGPLGFNEIVSLTAATNLASRKVMEKLGMTHLQNEIFDHPKVEASSPLCRHVLYRARKGIWFPKPD